MPPARIEPEARMVAKSSVGPGKSSMEAAESSVESAASVDGNGSSMAATVATGLVAAGMMATAMMAAAVTTVRGQGRKSSKGSRTHDGHRCKLGNTHHVMYSQTQMLY
jgi:hypothetical protein